MINALWLILIIPAAFGIGFFTNALMHCAKENWNDKDKK